MSLNYQIGVSGSHGDWSVQKLFSFTDLHFYTGYGALFG